MRRRKRLVQRSRKRSDHWTRKAKDEGYAARSVYKLVEIDKRFPVFARGQRVLDLGCSPGSWSRYARKRVGNAGALVGIDLTEVPDYPGHQHVDRSQDRTRNCSRPSAPRTSSSIWPCSRPEPGSRTTESTGTGADGGGCRSTALHPVALS